MFLVYVALLLACCLVSSLSNRVGLGRLPSLCMNFCTIMHICRVPTGQAFRTQGTVVVFGLVKLDQGLYIHTQFLTLPGQERAASTELQRDS
jgi:hypothetical protein